MRRQLSKILLENTWAKEFKDNSYRELLAHISMYKIIIVHCLLPISHYYNPNAHWQKTGQINYGIFTQWNTTNGNENEWTRAIAYQDG